MAFKGFVGVIKDCVDIRGFRVSGQLEPVALRQEGFREGRHLEEASAPVRGEQDQEQRRTRISRLQHVKAPSHPLPGGHWKESFHLKK